jgi:hypothetical protein
MRQAEYEAYLRKRGFGDATVKYSVGAVLELEGALGGKALNIIGVEDLRAYVESLIPRRRNSERRLVAIARYFHIVGNKPAYIYLVSLIGPRGGSYWCSRRGWLPSPGRSPGRRSSRGFGESNLSALIKKWGGRLVPSVLPGSLHYRIDVGHWCPRRQFAPDSQHVSLRRVHSLFDVYLAQPDHFIIGLEHY